MKNFWTLFLVCLVAALPSASPVAPGAPCRKIVNSGWYFFGSRLTCFMSSAINSTDFAITSSKNELVEVLIADRNFKVFYLPNNMGEKFPNLLVVAARICSIKQISKDVFKGLNKLKVLSLGHNKIEKIDRDTFDYLPALERIWMSHNNLTTIDSHAFVSLNHLNEVYLSNSTCIDDYFVGKARIYDLIRDSAESCAQTVGDK